MDARTRALTPLRWQSTFPRRPQRLLVYVNDRGRLAEVLGVLRAAIDVGAEAVPTRPLIHDVLE